MPYANGKVKAYSNKTRTFEFNPRAGTMDQPAAQGFKELKSAAPKKSVRPKARPAAPKTSPRPKKRPMK